MSSASVLRLLAAGLMTAALLCGGAALAKAASLEDLLTGQLVASGAPALLGPITSEGRKGWDCKPERAAAAAHSGQAELPPDPASP